MGNIFALSSQTIQTANKMTSTRMRAVVVSEGDKKQASSLSISSEVQRPELKNNSDALVKVKAFGLNRMDVMQRLGQYPLPPGVSTILGVEFSGIVEDAGSKTDYKKGDEVFGLAYGGAYAEYIVLNAGMLTRKPEELSFAQAAAIPEAWLTAFQALFLVAGMQEGAKVLIHAGASGVGVAANQLAKGFGAKTVFSTAGTPEKVEFLKKLGVDHAINYKTQKFPDEIQKLTDGQGVDVIVDFVGGSYFAMNIASAARDAHMVMLGGLGGLVTPEPINLGPVLFKRIRIEGTTLRSRTVEYQSDLLQRFSKEALPKLLKGHYELVLHKVLPWEKVVEATEMLEQSANMGKIVCTID